MNSRKKMGQHKQEEIMPNWYRTVVSVGGPASDIKKLCDAHFVHEAGMGFDFNTVIPMPACLDDIPTDLDVIAAVKELESMPVEAWKCIPEKWGTEVLSIARRSIQAKKETGHYNWFEWCNANWGIPSNARDFNIDKEGPESLTFSFETAWGPPEPVLAKLVDAYSTLKFMAEGREEFESKWSVIL
jgi:hypothetical protein